MARSRKKPVTRRRAAAATPQAEVERLAASLLDAVRRTSLPRGFDLQGLAAIAATCPPLAGLALAMMSPDVARAALLVLRPRRAGSRAKK